jgi:uncharacterized protein
MNTDNPAAAPWGTLDTRFDAIHSSARMRDVEGVRRELARGVPVDLLNGTAPNGDGGNTALWFAAQGPGPGGLEIVKVLIAAGAEVNRRCEHGRTALHMASAWGHLDVVKYLLEHGADATIEADEEGTPAEMARARDQQEVSEYYASLGR